MYIESANEYREKFDILASDIDEGRAERDNIIQLVEEIERILADETYELERTREKLEEYDYDVHEQQSDPTVELCMTPEEAEKLRAEEKELDEVVTAYKSLHDDIQDYLRASKIFDKYNCFNNIRIYMKDSDVKLGQIEKKAGVRIGYMSRLEKPDSASEPSIQFVATAANMLDVTIDELMYGKPGEITPTEKYVLDFLRDIIADTKGHELHWKKERDDVLGKPHKDLECRMVHHPLLSWDERNLDSAGAPYMMCFVSRFVLDEFVYVKNGVYHGTIPYSDSEIYIVPCFTVEGDTFDQKKDFFELYVVDGNENVSPLCSTLQTCPPIIAAINELYKAAMADASHVYVDAGLKNIIDSYRSSRNLPF